MDILIGIIVLILGAGVAGMGLRVWFWMLPILGFMAGFFLGAIIVFQIAGDGVFATLLSWVVGALFGVGFALISWFWWYFGVIIAAGAAGAALATGIASSVGAERSWVLLVFAIIGAVVFALGALFLNLPVYLIIANTAIAGGLAVISGLLLVFNRIDLDDLGMGHATAAVEDSLWWWLLWIAIIVAGIMAQLRFTSLVDLPEERFVPTSAAVRP